MARILKHCKEYLVEPSAYLINFSIEVGVLPNTLKLGIVRPTHKIDSKKEVLNYRPVRLISIFSKISEKLFVYRISNFFDLNSVTGKSKHNFREGLSTIKAAVFS